MELHLRYPVKPETMIDIINSVNPGKLKLVNVPGCVDRDTRSDPYINHYPLIDSCNSVEDPDRFPEVPNVVSIVEQLILTVFEK